MPTSTPPKKRQRLSLSSSSSSKNDPPTAVPNHNPNAIAPHHTLFTQWSQDRGVQIHNVKPAALPGRGIGLLTTVRIEKDTRILFVPAKAMFHARASPTVSAKAFRELQTRASPQALLAVCLAAEFLLDGRDGRDSVLAPWTATWPAPEELLASLPLHWSKEMRGLLPKSVDAPLRRQREDYGKDLEVWMEFAGAKGRSGERQFAYYWAIVNSRSFHFRPAGGKPGAMVLCPFIDYMNHAADGTGVVVRQTPKGYEVVADRDYDIGEEILATYGAHPNDKLLTHYGFTIPTRPNSPSDDDVRLDHLLIPALGEATCSALQDVGFLGGYALLPASNEICFKTQVAVRAKLLTANEWEYFIGSGEDLSFDHSANVREFLLDEVMKPFEKEAEERLAELAKLDVGEGESGERSTTENVATQVAVRSLRERWTQIRDAIATYVSEEQ